MRGERSGRRGSARIALIGCCVAVVAVLAGCGGGDGSDATNVLSAGQLNIQLPAGYKVVNGEVVRPASAKSTGASATTGASGTTLPGATGPSTAKQDTTQTTIVSTKLDPTTQMMAAFGKFRTCLTDLGVKFIGAPDQSNPNSPTNDPTYIKNLSTCAARSQIVQALQAQQQAAANATPADIKQQNKGYLKWRSCMVDRGWKIPTPTPDAQGRLFSFGGNGANAQSQIQPPPGKDLLTSTDLEQCAAKAQASTKAKS
jgi:hypothetical protein